MKNIHGMIGLTDCRTGALTEGLMDGQTEVKQYTPFLNLKWGYKKYKKIKH